MPHPSSGRFAFVLVAMLLAGCGSVKAIKSENDLSDRIRGFENALRWSEFELAEAFRSRSARESPTELDALQGVRVVGLTTRELGVDTVTGRASFSTELQYYREDTHRVRTVRYGHYWDYDEELEQWFLDSPLPDFR